MSKASIPEPGDDDDDPLAAILENEEAFESVGEREDRTGAIARYFLAIARGNTPDDYDAKLAGMPKLGGSDE